MTTLDYWILTDKFREIPTCHMCRCNLGSLTLDVTPLAIQFFQRSYCNDITIESRYREFKVGQFQKTLRKDSFNKFRSVLTYWERESQKSKTLSTILLLRGLTGLRVASALKVYRNVSWIKISVFYHLLTATVCHFFISFLELCHSNIAKMVMIRIWISSPQDHKNFVKSLRSSPQPMDLHLASPSSVVNFNKVYANVRSFGSIDFHLLLYIQQVSQI